MLTDLNCLSYQARLSQAAGDLQGLFGRGQMLSSVFHSLYSLLEIAQLKGIPKMALFLLAEGKILFGTTLPFQYIQLGFGEVIETMCGGQTPFTKFKFIFLVPVFILIPIIWLVILVDF